MKSDITFKGKSFHRLQIIILFLMLVVGFLEFRNYGISWDENTQRNSGVVFFNHLQQKFSLHLLVIPPSVPKLDEYRDKEFGATFEIFIFALERLFGFRDYKEVFLFRHFINFIFFWFGVVVFSSIIRSRYSKNYFLIIGCLILFLHPRIFAESFYNSKDIILMVFFIFSFRIFILFNETWKFRYAFWLALISALTFNIRPVGILIPILSLFLLFPAAIRFQHKENKWNRLISLVIFFSFFLILAWITNPYLWDNPLGKSMQIIAKFLKYDVSHTAGNIFFLGNYLPTNNLPWFYLPLWIGITTPIVYTIFFIIGLIIILKKNLFIRRIEFLDSGTRMDFFILGWLGLPLCAAILFHSTLYDGWRHFYFLWPAIVLFVLNGFDGMISIKIKCVTEKVRKSIWFFSFALILAAVISNGIYDYRWKAHQYCYFNILAPAPATNFELDYWGLSYKDALEYLVNKDSSDSIRIQVLNLPGYLNSFLLDPVDRKRLWYHNSLRENFSSRIESFYPFPFEAKFMKAGEAARYYISNFRDTNGPEELLKYRSGESPYINQEFSCKVNGYEIIGIYKLQPGIFPMMNRKPFP